MLNDFWQEPFWKNCAWVKVVILEKPNIFWQYYAKNILTVKLGVVVKLLKLLIFSFKFRKLKQSFYQNSRVLVLLIFKFHSKVNAFLVKKSSKCFATCLLFIQSLFLPHRIWSGFTGRVLGIQYLELSQELNVLGYSG